MFTVLEFLQHTAVLVGCRERCDEALAYYKIYYKDNIYIYIHIYIYFFFYDDSNLHFSGRNYLVTNRHPGHTYDYHKKYCLIHSPSY